MQAGERLEIKREFERHLIAPAWPLEFDRVNAGTLRICVAQGPDNARLGGVLQRSKDFRSQ